MESRTLSLFVFIDAFGWELLQRHSFLDDVCPDRGRLETVFGYSSTCDPTIVTGRPPREHGHFSFFVFDPEKTPFRGARSLRIFPRSITSRGRVRHWISKFYRRALGYTGYFQLYNVPFERLHFFDYTEKRDLYEPDGIINGSPTVFDRFRAEGLPYFMSDWRRSEEHNLGALASELDAGNIRFAYLYLASMDAILHARGTGAPEVAAKIAWYDAQLRRVLEQARKHYGDVRLHVFSDHGMTDIHDTCDLIPRIESLGLTFGRDYAVMYDSTMARFWFPDPAARGKIEPVLNAEPRGRVLSDEQLRAWGCDFPDRRYGDLFFLLDPGVLMVPSYMGEKPLAGMHGYSPEHEDSVAMYATNTGAADAPAGLEDLHDLMLRDVGLLEPVEV